MKDNKGQVRVRFDGPKLTGKAMDVRDLSAALLGLSDLCRQANKSNNGDRAAVQVLIKADVEQNCFEFDIQLIQSLWDQAKDLVGHHDIVSAKEILEWILLFSGIGGGSFGLLKFLSWLDGRKADKVKFITKDGKDQVQVFVKGENNSVTINRNVYNLSRDPSIVNSANKLLSPLKSEGYDSLTFETEGQVVGKFLSEDAERVAETAQIDGKEILDVNRITAWIQVYSPVYNEKAPRWRFMYGGHRVYMDISGTDIAKDAMNRGGAMVDDAYHVVIDSEQSIDADGKYHLNYRIVEVLDFKASNPPEQNDWV